MSRDQALWQSSRCDELGVAYLSEMSEKSLPEASGRDLGWG